MAEMTLPADRAQAPAWQPVVYVEAPPAGGIKTGRAVCLPGVLSTQADALAAAMRAMETTPGAVSCTALRVVDQRREGGAA